MLEKLVRKLLYRSKPKPANTLKLDVDLNDEDIEELAQEIKDIHAEEMPVIGAETNEVPEELSNLVLEYYRKLADLEKKQGYAVSSVSIEAPNKLIVSWIDKESKKEFKATKYLPLVTDEADN